MEFVLKLRNLLCNRIRYLAHSYVILEIIRNEKYLTTVPFMPFFSWDRFCRLFYCLCYRYTCERARKVIVGKFTWQVIRDKRWRVGEHKYFDPMGERDGTKVARKFTFPRVRDTRYCANCARMYDK